MLGIELDVIDSLIPFELTLLIYFYSRRMTLRRSAVLIKQLRQATARTSPCCGNHQGSQPADGFLHPPLTLSGHAPRTVVW